MGPFLVVRNKATSSGRALAKELDSPISRIKGKPIKTRRILINWGSAELVRKYEGVMLNPPEAVYKWSNKKYFLKNIRTARVPEVLSHHEAKDLVSTGKRIVQRDLLRASGGRGMNIIRSPQELSQTAPLFVRYIPKRYEYRLHCFKWSGIADIQQKKKRRDVGKEVNPEVRNVENGWVYCREGVVVPCDVMVQGWKAFEETGLDFGAVDVIWNKKAGEAWVLEINTAPGLEGTTLSVYAEQFNKLVTE